MPKFMTFISDEFKKYGYKITTTAANFMTLKVASWLET